MWIVPSHKALFLALRPFLYLLLISPSAIKILLLDVMGDFLPYNPVFQKKKTKKVLHLRFPVVTSSSLFLRKKRKDSFPGVLYIAIKSLTFQVSPKRSPQVAFEFHHHLSITFVAKACQFFPLKPPQTGPFIVPSSSPSFSPHVWTPAVAASPTSSCPPS